MVASVVVETINMAKWQGSRKQQATNMDGVQATTQGWYSWIRVHRHKYIRADTLVSTKGYSRCADEGVNFVIDTCFTLMESFYIPSLEAHWRSDWTFVFLWQHFEKWKSIPNSFLWSHSIRTFPIQLYCHVETDLKWRAQTSCISEIWDSLSTIGTCIYGRQKQNLLLAETISVIVQRFTV